MAPQTVLFTTSAACTFLLGRYAPEYALFASPITSLLVTYAITNFGWFIWAVLVYPHFFCPLRKLPQPQGGSWINGHLWAFFNEPPGEPQRRWSETIPNDGLIMVRTLFNEPNVFVTTPKALSEVLVTRAYEFTKPVEWLRALSRMLGVGILLAERDEHKVQRKSLNPAFAYRHIKELYPIFWSKAQEMVQEVDKTISTPEEKGEESAKIVEVGKWMSRSTLDIIGAAGFDKSFDAVKDETNELYQNYQEAFRIDRSTEIMELAGLFLPFWFLSRLPVTPNRRVNNTAQHVRKVCRDLIRDKREALKNDRKDVDILSVAMRSGTFDDENLVNQLMTFLAAGHETTASAMQWALVLLCQHPKALERLREALLASDLPSIRGSKETVTADVVDNIPYLSAVVNEVLRHTPPVPFTLRIADKNTTIVGQFIPKGTYMLIPVHTINRSPELWGEDACDFKPERWLGEGAAHSGGATNNFAFMTFLHGPRSCIGSTFAKAEFAVLLAAWVLAFDFELEDPEKPIEAEVGLTMKPKGGLKLKVKVRDE